MSGRKLHHTLHFMLIVLALCAGCQREERRGSSGNEDAIPGVAASTRLSAADARQASSRSKHLRRSSGERTGAPTPNGSTTATITRVSGIITLPDGKPAAGAKVTLYTTPEDETTTMPYREVASTQTNPAGSYALQSSGGSYWAVIATKPGFALVGHRPINYFDSTTNDKIPSTLDLALRPEAPFAGRVLNATGAPVAGAHVLASDSQHVPMVNQLNCYTDSDGRFKISGAPAGRLSVAVAPPDAPAELFYPHLPDINAELRLKETSGLVDVRLISDKTDLTSMAITISGKRNCPLGGLTLTQQAKRDATDHFSFGKLFPAKYLLSLTAAPPEILYSRATPTGKILQKKQYRTVELKDKQTTTIEMYVTGGKPFRGVVVDVATSQPLAGVRLYPYFELEKRNRSLFTTGADGTFELTNVPDPDEIIVKAENYHRVWPDNDNADNKMPEDFTTITLASSPWLRGKVTDGRGSEVVGAKLTLFTNPKVPGSDVNVPIGTGGHFAVSAKPGKYILVAEAEGFAPATNDKIILEQDDINDIKITLGRGRSASGIVINTEGKPIAGAIVTASTTDESPLGTYFYDQDTGLRTDERLRSTRTNNNGKFVLPLLPVNTSIVISGEASGFALPDVYHLPDADHDTTGIKLTLPNAVNINGTVIDETGTPLAEADVTCYTNANMISFWATTSTSTSGTFQLADFPAKTTYTLSISLKDYEKFSKELNTNDSSVSVTLRSSTGINVLVKCIDIKSGKPLQAEVTIKDRENYEEPLILESVKGQTGCYTVTLVAGHNYYFTAKAEDYAVYTQFGNWETNQKEITLGLRRNGKVKGRVVDEKNNAIPSAKIVMNHFNETLATSDANGKFELGGDNADSELLAGKDDRYSAPFQGKQVADSDYDVGDIVLRSPQQLTVRVLRGESDPASNIAVEIKNYMMPGDRGTASGKTDSKGEFKTEIAPGYPVNITLPDYKVSYSDASGTNQQEKSRIIVLHIGGATVRGRLLFNNEPVAGTISAASESYYRQSNSIDTASDGRFEFKNLPPGPTKFSLSSRSNSYNQGSVQLTIPDSDEVIEKDFNLFENKIVGTVLDDAGTPVQGAKISATSDGGQAASDETNAVGVADVKVIQPGTFRVYATKPDVGRSDTVSVTIPESGGEIPVTLKLKSETGTITVNALSLLDGLPIKYVYGKLLTPGGKTVEEIGGYDGVAVIKDIPIGEYQVSVSSTGYSEARRNITLEANQSLDITEVLSPASSVKVAVSDSNGKVVVGAPVALTPLDGDSLESVQTLNTADTGIALFPSVLFGNYEVRVTGPAGTTAQSIISTRNQQLTQVHLILAIDESGE